MISEDENRKIVLLSGIYPPDQGGPARFAETFPFWAHSNHGCNVNVISYTDGMSQQIQHVHGLTILLSRKSNILKRILISASLIAREGRQQATIIANGMFIEVAIAKLLYPKLKYVMKLPGDVVWERSMTKGRTSDSIEKFQNLKLHPFDKMHRGIINFCLRKSRIVICPSAQLATFASNWGVSNRKIKIIGNAVDERIYKVMDSERDIEILSVCRLVSWKNLDKIIRISSILKKNLYIAGEGSEHEYLDKLAAELKVNVHFLGHVESKELPHLYNRTQLFMLASDYEGMPYSLIEAQMCGVFSIANGATGSKDVISDGVTGLLSSTSDLDEMLELVRQFFASENFNYSREEISKLSKSRFGFDSNFEKIYQAIGEI
jgi:glycosyltransferase involved in cell wall biosynthesis